MKNYLSNVFIITVLFFINNLAYAESDIQQGDILAFDPSQACYVLTTKLEKMQEELEVKRNTVKFWETLLRSAAPSAYKYGDLNLNYQSAMERFESTKKEYDRLVLAKENHCMPTLDKNTN